MEYPLSQLDLRFAVRIPPLSKRAGCFLDVQHQDERALERGMAFDSLGRSELSSCSFAASAPAAEARIAFQKVYCLPHFFERRKKIRVIVFLEKLLVRESMLQLSSKVRHNEQLLLACGEFSLKDMVASKAEPFTVALDMQETPEAKHWLRTTDDAKRGVDVLVTFTERTSARMIASIHFMGRDMPSKSFVLSKRRSLTRSFRKFLSTADTPYESTDEYGGSALGGRNWEQENALSLVVQRPLQSDVWESVLRSAPISADSKGGADFGPLTLSRHQLNGGEDGRTIRIELQRLSLGEGFVRVAYAETTLRRLLDLGRSRRLVLVSIADGKLQPCGELELVSVSLSPSPSFLEFHRSESVIIDTTVAIDFTASNLDPSIAQSLHNSSARVSLTGSGTNGDEGTLNPYERCLCQVYELLSPYSASGMSMFGFGARIPPLWGTSHCFSLSPGGAYTAASMCGGGKQGQPFTDLTCTDREKVLYAYRRAAHQVAFAGPTLFAHFIRMLRIRSEKFVAERIPAYTFAIILTDGVMKDLVETVSELIQLSSLGCSVVIMGVGSSNFAPLEALVRNISGAGGYQNALVRNMVQFVDAGTLRTESDILRLQSAIGRLPHEFMEFMRTENVDPAAANRTWSRADLSASFRNIGIVPSPEQMSAVSAESYRNVAIEEHVRMLVNSSTRIQEPSGEVLARRPAVSSRDDS
ncbi:Protein BONZAI 1 [Porphyridium purpureum]|uniref:Protein BONZAI 1 n=1 Tax=Porphyridium purpureum TaxID=35688 RepID=A0A5J4Z3P5_PORPP|nr:Protein BONZAI 1 [Porphyridium purpureum]|eukprot:POR7260..scf295_1